jgi:uncharacterized Rmd1/YagE family protein
VNTSLVPSLALPFSPPPGSPVRLTVSAVYFEGVIDVKRFRADHLHYPVLAADPLVLEPVRGSYVVLSKFGVLVLWNCGPDVKEEILAEVAKQPGAGKPYDNVTDHLDVLVGSAENTVTFSQVGLRELTLDKLKILSLALAQSVALDRIELEVVQALANVEPAVADLKRDGRLRLSQKEVLRAVGFTLEVRAAVLASLTLFDKPPETWESEILERLDSQLYDFFDLEERLAAVKEKVAYLTDINTTLMTVLAHRKDVRLEWTIIILIAVEVVFFLWEKLLKLLAEQP